MRCNPSRWLWGLLPLAVLALIVNWLERPRIESDLANRTKDAVAKAGMGWADLNFTKGGRDGLITGEAAEEAERDKIHDLASSVWGVRTIDNKAKLLDKVDKYTWSVSRLDTKEIRIKGLAPSDTDRKAIVKMAEARFPGYKVNADMKLARGVPDKQAWLGGIDYSLKQLEQLKKGQAELDNLSLTISGDAGTTSAYKSVRTALGSLPKGIVLKQERIAAPVISPFNWEARAEAKQIVLSGYAPSDKAREQVLSEARLRFKDRTVVDRMEVGGGAPKDWERAADVALTQLAKLEIGAAELKDVDISLSGVAAEEATKDVVAAAMKTGLPAAFRGVEKVTFRIPKVAGVSPYLTRAVYSGEQLILLGHAPSEAERDALVAYTRAQFPSYRVVDRLNIAAGQPDHWQDCAKAGVSALKSLGNGQYELKDKDYILSGSTKDEGLHKSIPMDLGKDSQGCSGKALIELVKVAPPPPPPVATAAAPAPVAAAPVVATPPPPVTIDICQKLLDEAMHGGVINFERAKAELQASSYPTLDKLAQVAARCPKARIEIGGHTDARGSAELNQRLSEERAQSVAAYLANKGVDQNRLFPIGYGPSRPIAPNDTDEDRARNRRIEFLARPN